MNPLTSLIRVHKWALDEKRQKLAGLEELVRKMRVDLAEIDRDLDREKEAATESMAGTMAFPAFMAAAMERRRRLRQTIAELEQAAEEARDEVQAAFQEVKSYELALERHEREEQARLDRDEQIALDEVGATMHLRRGAPEDG